MTKRKYHSDLPSVELAFSACWRNAADLVKAAKLLLDSGLQAPALSLSVLALEELGKLFCVEGLLFAQTDDLKAQAFSKSLRSHSLKLDALVLFPTLLGRLARLDPRSRTERSFVETMAISITDLKDRGNLVSSLLEGKAFRDLDTLKQVGFYAQPKDGTFTTPNDAVTRELADAVYHLAWRASSSLDFLFREGNLERYMELARAVRAKFTQADHQQLEALARAKVASLFGSADADPDA